MRVLGRVLGSTAFMLLLVAGVQADTIYMKNGSVLRGKVVGYGDGQFTVQLGTGGQSRAILVGSEIERIEFDDMAGGAPSYSQPTPTSSSPRYEPSTASTDPYPEASADPGATSYPSSSESTGYDPAATASQEVDVSVQARVDWTPSQVRVRRGDQITITASGSVQLDRTGKRSSPPAGVNVPDRDKLLTGRPTGALIAVIGDDNDDFIFVGQQADFVASRDGMLFLSVNEGNLSDNSGAYRAHVAVRGSGAPAPASTARKNSGGGSATKPRNDSASTSPPPAKRANNAPAVSVPPASTDDSYAADPAPSNNPPVSGSAPTAKPAVSANAAVREADIVVQAKNDWTSTQIQVQRGAKIRITAVGTVQLDKTGQRTASPSGIEAMDRGKLIPDRPTGALIAVIGDDNDDFIFVGQQGEFVASRDGLLFLSINEGELSDNTGVFNVHIVVEQPRTVAKQ